MNKLIASVGVIALSSSVLHALETGSLNAQQSKKAWSVSASLRGFYDDNYNSQPSATKKSSTGGDLAVGFDFGTAGEVTSVNVGYDLTARYYEKALSTTSSDHTDYTHSFNAGLTHAFNERLRRPNSMKVRDRKAAPKSLRSTCSTVARGPLLAL